MIRDDMANDAERRVWDAFPIGATVDLGTGEPADSEFQVDSWDADRSVRAEVIARLLLGIRPPQNGYVAKVVLLGARIVGVLELNEAPFTYELFLERCWLDSEPDLGGAATQSLSLVACRVPGLAGFLWRCAGQVSFDRSAFTGMIDMSGARVSGWLGLSGAELSNPDGLALYAPNLTVERNMSFRDGFTATGGLNLSGAKIGGLLDLDGAKLVNDDGDCLQADNITVEQSMFCRDGFTATGRLNLNCAKIGGQLELDGATLSNPDGDALHAYNLTVEHSMFCREGFTANGRVDLNGANVGGQLDFANATLTNPQGDALGAYNLTVRHSMFCNDSFTAHGVVNLHGANIGGQLDLSNATLINPGGSALIGQNLTVHQDLICAEDFRAEGNVDISGAKIGGWLELDGATLSNPGADALNATNLTVNQSMFCRDGFTATGTVALGGAKINGQVDLNGATLSNPDGDALYARHLTVTGTMYCTEGFKATGTVDLRNADIDRVVLNGSTLSVPPGEDPSKWVVLDARSLKVGRLRLPTPLTGIVDLRQASLDVLEIPPASLTTAMRLSGLVYKDLDPDPDPPLRQRMRWLSRDPDGYHPQPYEQLAGYYRVNGNDREARLTLLRKRRAHRRHTTGFSFLRRLPGWIIDGLAGYGYVPARAFAWLVASLAVGTWLLYPDAPTGPTKSHLANAALLAIDSIIPTSPFGLRSSAALSGGAFVTATVLQVLGFALSIAVLPAVTRALARADK